ncbi:hydrophobe/amphiphile efflux-1 family RND transporter [Pontibacter diazotrophicus]|uniref:Hydrophobe/amphiphile efflux-1 family RND transporter n=1 Tax=Pontibacter diazotrophicus TaxID=1400979 RepID=A0A3D8LI50_9BACT|nr:efflux RND transporter permease subunit [Pontibacter diazotrophicus]RDV16562.1 hydrophobe/amphiphile efflux-1 family RND transporter [Pontibacter diazotrophicus]
MIKTFIDRPVLSTVMSVIICFLGVLGITLLPVTLYPEIAPPSVEVRTQYTGASAETILESVIIPLEEEINGAEGLDYITSTASNSGSVTIRCFFTQETDPDFAAVDIQNRISRANPLLPPEVIRSGITIQKQETSALMRVTYYTSNEEEFNDVYVQNYMNINVITPMLRINGVADVVVYGDKEYAMRIWLKPDQLASYNLVPEDVLRALDEQSVEAAPGALGQNAGRPFEYVLQYQGRFKTQEQYGNIIIRSLDNNQILRLKDVADVQLDAFTYSSLSIHNGKPSINTAVYQLPGSNAQEVIQEVRALLEEKSKAFPEGVEYEILYDVNDFLSASISSLVWTLVQTFLLVFLVVFLFLQSWRATIVPAVAVPVSIVGSFFFLNLFGYSINLLTLFALILAIGIVVDDAIVVVEAVQAKLEEGEKDVRKATLAAMKEITSAIISTTLVMAAVFVPVTFLTGSTGIFYEQFGVTLTIAIVISSFNALTLSPALCVLVLKPKEDSEKEQPEKKNAFKKFFGRFRRGFNKRFEQLNEKYVGGVTFLGGKKWVIGVAVLVCAGGAYWLNRTLPGGFVPTEDRNIIFFDMQLPAGASLDRTYQATEEFYQQAKDIPGVRAIALVSGSSFFAGEGGSYGLGFAALHPLQERDADSVSIEAITEQLQQAAAPISDARFVFFQPGQIPGLGRTSGFTVELLNTGDVSLQELNEVANSYVAALNRSDIISGTQSSFDTGFPQYQVNLNVPRIKAAGLNVDAVLSALQGYIGGIYAADFSRFGKQYRVYVQSLPEYREEEDDLNRIFVRNDEGEMAPVSEFVTLERIYGPQSVSRFNLYTSVSITGDAATGYSSGDALEVVEAEAEKLGALFDIDFSGMTREQLEFEGQLSLIFMLSLFMVFFFLSAQFESYILPFSILLSLPLGVAGSYFISWLFGLENNVYFQISLIMLLGLLAKNAILIVQYGQMRRKENCSIKEAGTDAARIRLRPILMTALSFVVGILPLVLASGVGEKGKNAIGTGAAGGLLVGTLLGIFAVPVLFMLFQRLHEHIAGGPKQKEDA